jgi:hypothetical protein
MASQLGDLVSSVLFDISGLNLNDAVRSVISRSRFYAINSSYSPFLKWELDALTDTVVSYISGSMANEFFTLTQERSFGAEVDSATLAKSESLDWLLENTLSDTSTAEDIGRYFVCLCYRYRYCNDFLEPVNFSYLIDLIRHVNRLYRANGKATADAVDDWLPNIRRIFSGIESGEFLYIPADKSGPM